MKFVQTKYSVRDGGHYTPGIKCNGMLYISGQLSINPETGKPAEGGIKAEAAQALKNLDTVLSAAGIGKNQVVSCKAYLDDISNWGAFNEVYSEYFGDHKPVRIVVPVGDMYGGASIEIEAVACYEEK